MTYPGNRSDTSAHRAARRVALENEALLAARELVDRMRALYRELERMTDAPISMHRALVCIAGEPGLPASRLAMLLGMRRPAVSQMLKSLSVRGWIERSRGDGDQRSVQIHVTAAGQKILRATAGRAVGTLQRAVRSISSRELGSLAKGLGSLLSKLPKEVIAQPPARSKTRARRRALQGRPGLLR